MPRATWNVAAVQMNSNHHRTRNRRQAESLVRAAAAAGADLVALPENFSYLRTEGTRVTHAERLDGELVAWLSGLARGLRIHLLAGSIPEAIPRSPRIHNTSVLLGPDGAVLATYRKMHLFDIDIRGGAVLQESRFVVPGTAPVIADTPLGRLGLTICYDVRFPELYRRLALDGALVLFVPAAFTAYTGPHHWLPLLQARAIENQCWVVAPAQAGRHNATRESFGHTAVFDPWGKLVGLVERPEPGFVIAKIDYRAQDRIRAGLPCLRHARRELHPGGWPADRRARP